MTEGAIDRMITGYEVSDEIKQKLMDIYDIYNKYNPTIEEAETGSKLVNEVLAAMFKNPFAFAIPFDFIESELGTMLFEIKFIHQRYYSTQDMSIILKKSTSNLYYNNKNGHLRMQNKGGVYLTTEGELRRYMKMKKISDAEIDLRLDAFWAVKIDNLTAKISREELEKQFKKEIEKRSGKKNRKRQ